MQDYELGRIVVCLRIAEDGSEVVGTSVTGDLTYMQSLGLLEIAKMDMEPIFADLHDGND